MLTPVALLIVALVAIAIGPAVVSLGARVAPLKSGLDGLSLALVVGLCLLHLIPHALEHGGFAAVVAAVTVAIAPMLLDRLGALNGMAWKVGLVVLLAMHAALDGAALAVVQGGAGLALAMAVAAHRLPVGLLVFGSASRVGGVERPRTGWLAIGILAVATVGGFVAGPLIAGVAPESAEGILEGLVVGALVHILFEGRRHAHHAPDDPHHGHAHAHAYDPMHSDHDHHHEDVDPGHGPSVAGALIGLAALSGFVVFATGQPALEHTELAALTFVDLALTCAPALLVGYTLAGLFAGLFGAPSFFGKGPATEALSGVGFGARLPLCSCGVLPLYESLVRRGVSETGAVAFLVAAPALGIEALVLTVPLLGGPVATARVVGALAIALVVGVGIGSMVAARGPQAVDHPPEPPTQWLVGGLKFAYIDLVDHTLPWVALGVTVAAVVEPVLGHDLMVRVPPALQVVSAGALAIPFYVCAAGATPLAAIAVHKGLSAGAALTYLLAAPVLNGTTFGVLAKLHGRATAVRWVAGVVALSIAVGWAVDALPVALPSIGHGGAHGPWAWSALAVVALLGLASLLRQGPRGTLGQILEPIHAH